MNDSQYKTADTIIKIFGVLGLAAGGILTWRQYFDGRAERERTALTAAQQPLQAQRQQLYGEAIRAVTTLAVSTEPKKLKDAEEAFWTLYWGPLATVESREVEAIMVQMGQCLDTRTQCSPAERRRFSLDLAHQIRTETSANWNVSLPELNKAKH